MTNPDGGRSRLAVCLSDAGFSRQVLAELLASECYPALILLPEYAPAPARGPTELASPPVRAIIELIGDLPLVYAAGIDDRALATQLRESMIDYLLVACWPWLLGPRIRAAPTQAALNLHPSCLPRYRGIDPVGDQLAVDEPELGVSLHLLDERFDHGDIVARQGFELPPDERTRGAIERRAARCGIALVLEAMRTGPGGWKPRAQDQAFDTD